MYLYQTYLYHMYLYPAYLYQLYLCNLYLYHAYLYQMYLYPVYLYQMYLRQLYTIGCCCTKRPPAYQTTCPKSTCLRNHGRQQGAHSVACACLPVAPHLKLQLDMNFSCITVFSTFRGHPYKTANPPNLGLNAEM